MLVVYADDNIYLHAFPRHLDCYGNTPLRVYCVPDPPRVYHSKARFERRKSILVKFPCPFLNSVLDFIFELDGIFSKKSKTNREKQIHWKSNFPPYFITIPEK